ARAAADDAEQPVAVAAPEAAEQVAVAAQQAIEQAAAAVAVTIAVAAEEVADETAVAAAGYLIQRVAAFGAVAEKVVEQTPDRVIAEQVFHETVGTGDAEQPVAVAAQQPAEQVAVAARRAND